jgi:hypothetical protein
MRSSVQPPIPPKKKNPTKAEINLGILIKGLHRKIKVTDKFNSREEVFIL